MHSTAGIASAAATVGRRNRGGNYYEPPKPRKRFVLTVKAAQAEFGPQIGDNHLGWRLLAKAKVATEPSFGYFLPSDKAITEFLNHYKMTWAQFMVFPSVSTIADYHCIRHALDKNGEVDSDKYDDLKQSKIWKVGPMTGPERIYYHESEDDGRCVGTQDDDICEVRLTGKAFQAQFITKIYVIYGILLPRDIAAELEKRLR
jgi:hypothetical protein